MSKKNSNAILKKEFKGLKNLSEIYHKFRLKLGITMVQLGEKDQGCKMISGIKKEYPKANKSVLQKAQYEQKKFKCKS